MAVAAADAHERAERAAGIAHQAEIAGERVARDGLAVHVGQRRRIDGRRRARHHRRHVVAGCVLGGHAVEVAAQAADDRQLRGDPPFVLREHGDVAERGVGHAHRTRRRRRTELHRRGEHHRRRAARPQRHLADHERRRRGEAAVTAAIAIEGGAGGDDVILRRGQHGLQIHAGRPHALLGLGDDREAHHRNREERHGGRGRELHRQRVLQQPVDLLVVGRERQVGEPRRDRLRLVARRHLLEVALRQRGGVEEVGIGEIGEADVLHPPALVAQAQAAVLTELHEAGGIEIVALRL